MINDLKPASRRRPTTVASRRALFEQARAILAVEYGRDIGLDELAKRLAASRRQLQRAFTETGGTTFRACLTGIRMRQASEMLVHTNESVMTIARRVGYKQPAQFAKAFRRRFGSPPSEYRVKALRSMLSRAA